MHLSPNRHILRNLLRIYLQAVCADESSDPSYARQLRSVRQGVRYELIRKHGTEEIVLHVPHYDFNWQPIYEFKEALRIEREKSFVAAHDMTTAREILPTRIPPAR